MKTTTQYLSAQNYTFSPKKPPTLWLAKIWFAGCVITCLGTGGMLVKAWQSTKPTETELVLTGTAAQPDNTEKLSAAAALAAKMNSDSQKSASKTPSHFSTQNERDRDELTVWFDSSQR